MYMYIYIYIYTYIFIHRKYMKDVRCMKAYIYIYIYILYIYIYIYIYIYTYFVLEVPAWCYGAFASINRLRLSTIMYAVANVIH